MATLKKIDWKIICAFQRAVRQIELYTPLTLRMMIMSSLIMICCGAVGISTYKPENIAAKFFAGYFFLVLLLYIFVGDKVFPRKFCFEKHLFARILLILYSPIIFILDVPLLYFLIKDQDQLVFFIFITMNSAVVFFYLICCESLPPGEKQRRKKKRQMEKERKNLLPQAG